MAHVTADRVRDTSTTTGTGAFSVSGTAPTGYRTFSAVLSTSDTCWYAIQHQTAAEWEVGLGTYSSLNTITRTTVLASSNAGSAVNFSAGTKDIFITLAATKTVQQDDSGAVAIDANSSSNALRITQTGAGNALLVEDSANPDSTPFVIDAAGKIKVGYTGTWSGISDPNIGIDTNQSASFGTTWFGYNSAAPIVSSVVSGGTTFGSNNIVANGQNLGRFRFYGTDGSSPRLAATIDAAVDGTPGASDMPGRLMFSTTADGAALPTERMRITSAGNVGIGTTNPTALFNVVAGTSSDAVRITQTGAGNALVVEDSANPDATPFVVNANGVVGIGEASPSSYVSAGLVLRSSTAFTPQILAWNTTNDTNAPYWYSQKDRAGAIVNNGDALGTFLFQGYDGAAYRIAAYIGATVDGTPGASDMPGRLVFFTTPDGSASPTERMRINSAGNVGIGTTTFGTSASKVLALGNATAPTTGPADTIQIYSSDLSAGNTMLSLYTEGTPVNANTTAATTHRIAIRVNGTVYYLLANTAA